MSKKVLHIEGIKNELEGASLYFAKPPVPLPSQVVSNKEPSKHIPESENFLPGQVVHSISQTELLTKRSPRGIAKKRAIVHASIDASRLAPNQDDLIETIRKAVKQVGKETVFIRLTPAEKAELASIVFTFNKLYRGDNRKVSENVVGRIAISHLLHDYRENGEMSILARVLAALNA